MKNPSFFNTSRTGLCLTGIPPERRVFKFSGSCFFASGETLVASARAGNVIGGGDWAADRLIPDLIKAGGIAVDEENSSIGLVPNMMNPVSDVATAKAINKFVDMLEDLEDVQDVYTNMETTDEVDAALEAEG